MVTFNELLVATGIAPVDVVLLGKRQMARSNATNAHNAQTDQSSQIAGFGPALSLRPPRPHYFVASTMQ
jgi:hypothetical protein